MTALAAYLRVSDEKQIDRFSLPAQRDMIRAYCAREALGDPRWYVEEGRSALSDDYESRPQFAALLADAESRRVRRLVVVDIDRFARSVRGGLAAAARLELAGCRLDFINQPFDVTTPEGEMQFTVHLMFARYESKQKGRRNKAAHARMRAEGKWPGGSPPFGALRDADGFLQLDPVKLPALARLLELVAAGTYYRAAETLNAEGYPPPGTYRRARMHASRLWTAHSVYLVVKKGGWLLRQPEPWPARYDAAAARPQYPPVAHRRTVRFLTGLMRCGACGAAVVYSVDTRRDKVRLRCEQPNCRAFYSFAEGAENFVRGILAGLTPKEFSEDMPELDREALADIAEERRRVIKQYDDFRRTKMTDEEYDRRMDDLDVREAALRAEALPARDFAGVVKLLPDLLLLPLPEQNWLARQLIDRVIIVSKHEWRIAWRAEAASAFDGCR